jgi:hypothetical protein
MATNLRQSLSMDAPPSPLPPRRFRWLQFSLRTMLLAIVMAALGLGWYSREMRRRERIERATELLAVAPSVYTTDYDPIALVRAVNSLRALGKDDAVVALRRFAERYPARGDDLSPHNSLDLVMPLAFERSDPEDEYPSFWITAREDWDGFLTVHKDIPFRRGSVLLMGREGDKIELINWAQAHGRLRATALRPADDPLAAAEAAIEAWHVGQELDRSSTEILSPMEEAKERNFAAHVMREEGLRCIAHLLKLRADDLPYLGQDDAEWSRLKAECRRLGIRWSEERQEYVATKERAD